MTANSDQAQFLDLLDRHKAALYRVASVYARGEAREDLVQDIVLQLWRSFPGYDRDRPFAAWMKRIALNVAFSGLRRDYRRPVHEHLGAEDARILTRTSDPPEDAAARLLQRALDALGEVDRALLLLHLEDHGPSEIAEILGLSTSNVSTRLHRIRKRLAHLSPPTGIDP